MTLWLSFMICTSLIVYSGTRLAGYGDIVAEKTGLGRAWIGLVLGLTYRAEKKKLFPARDSAGITLIFLINLMLLYRLK